MNSRTLRQEGFDAIMLLALLTSLCLCKLALLLRHALLGR